MTLADLSPGEIFVGVAHTIREKTGSSESEAFPVADQVAQRLSPSRSFNDKLFPSLLRRYELVNSVKASIQLDDQTDQTIYDAAMQALKKNRCPGETRNPGSRRQHRDQRRAKRPAASNQAGASAKLHPFLCLPVPPRSPFACHDEYPRPGNPGGPFALPPPRHQRFAVGGRGDSTWPDPHQPSRARSVVPPTD